jgi:hypothetical protein
MDKNKQRRVLLLVAAAAVVPAMLAACSSGSGSSSSGAASSAQGGAASTSGTDQSGIAQFAQCMRQNGVTDFPDPQNGHFVMGGNVQSNPHFNSAIQACQHLLGPGGISSGNNSGAQSARLAFAHCMQTHGVPSFPDPSSNGAIQAPGGVDRNSATYQNAFNTCKSKLPNGGAGLQG